MDKTSLLIAIHVLCAVIACCGTLSRCALGSQKNWLKLRYLAKHHAVPDRVRGELVFEDQGHDVDVKYNVRGKTVTVRDYQGTRTPFDLQRVWAQTKKASPIGTAAVGIKVLLPR